MMLISGGYNLVTNIQGGDCGNNLGWERRDPEFCDPSRISILSLVNKRFSEDELLVNSWLNLGTVVLMILAFYFYRRQAILTAREVDNSQQTPADYTIVIKNLPPKVTDQEIRDFINKDLFFDQKVDIVKIVRGYKIREYVLLNRKKQKIQAQLLKKDDKHKEKLKKELKEIKERLDLLEKQSEDNLETSSYAYITFEKEEVAEEALCRMSFRPKIKKLFFYLGFSSCFNDILFKGSIKLVAQRAPEPSDILWENLGTPKTEKTVRRLLTFFSSVLLIGVCFGIITAINVGQDSISNPSHKQDSSETQSRRFVTEVISLAIALIIMIINNILNFSTREFATFESHSTSTSYFISVARRLTLVTFINTAITLLVTHIILQNLWKEGGLINDVFTVFLITIIVSPLSNILNPLYFWRLYQRAQIKKQGNSCTLTQREANILFEGPSIDIAQDYANVMKTVWLTAFYAPILPIGLPISLVGIFLSYWTDKYLLLKRYAKPSELGKALNEWMCQYLELTPFFFALGNLVFHRLIKGRDFEVIDDPLPTFLSLGISLIHFVIPLNSITKWCLSDDSNIYKKPYSEMRVFFNNDYDISNPIYRDEAIENWLQVLEKASEANEGVKEQLQEELKRHPRAGRHSGGRGGRGRRGMGRGNRFGNLRNYAQFSQGLSMVGDVRFHGTVPNRPFGFNHPPGSHPPRWNVSGAHVVNQSLPEHSVYAQPQNPVINQHSDYVQPKPHVNLNFEQRPPNQNPISMGTSLPNLQNSILHNSAFIHQNPNQNNNPKPHPNGQWEYHAPYGQGQPQGPYAQYHDQNQSQNLPMRSQNVGIPANQSLQFHHYYQTMNGHHQK